MNRRDLIKTASAAAAFGSPLIAACSRKDDALQKLLTGWQTNWRTMEAIAERRGWEVTAVAIAPPASEAAVAAVELRHGMKVPPQLRAVLTQLSARVTFGWSVPSHKRPMELVEHRYPTVGGIRDFIWSLDHADQYAIGDFLMWKRDLAGRDLSEARNAPEMWDNQFPFADLPNGDKLTIDTSQADPARQPVRYFSHELEGLHAHALAPDFLSFITAYSALGCAGSTHDDWFPFIDKIDAERRVAYLNAAGEGAKRWFIWRDAADDARHPDDPPPAIVETTAADRALLDAARANLIAAVNAALLAGAKPDCVPSSEWQMDTMSWDQQFFTAISYATRHDNTAMIERLLKAGATLNTRHLPLNVAVKEGSLETVKWLIAKGARVNGWKDQRYWPLHDLVVTRGKDAARSKEQHLAEIRSNNEEYGLASDPAAIADKLARIVDMPTYLAMLEALLAAGATPDAIWDNGMTMLRWGDAETARVLLKHGADVHHRDAHGWTALHDARTPEKARVLVAAGADINAPATPPAGDPGPLPYTPLQSALMSQTLELARTLLELRADPKIRDGDGRSTLAYCRSIEAFTLMQPFGLSPAELQPGGMTLLHNHFMMSWAPRATFPDEVAFLDFLIGLGIDINARDDKGRTILHYAAEKESNADAAPNYELLLARGADKLVKDNEGRRAVDLLAKSLKMVRQVLQ
ncbi:MAG: ankyrin repeat domain-containing protein [Candidatus Hydrogenedentes bacterium]|nr:ankyrin repeat domain-containing protein [Candidatus Hydrogenedentota bacterium]